MLPAERRPVVRKNVDAELKNADAVMRQLALPWAAMVGAVEGAARPEIALLSMQPDAQQRSLRLTAEAPRARRVMGMAEVLTLALSQEERGCLVTPSPFGRGVG